VRRIGNKFGGTVSCHFQVHISDVHATKRVAYARVQKGQDHSRKCWADHTKLTVPPEPNRHRVWRAHDSRKPVPVRKRWKSKTSFLMLFKVLFAEACPKTIPEAVRVATKIVAELSSAPQKWGKHLDETYQEILDVNGAGTHYMDDVADVETD